MLLKKLVTGLLLVGSLMSLVSCGSNSTQIVKGLKFETINESGNLKVRVSTDIDFGNIMFPSLQMPILKDGVAIGSVSMIPVLGSKTQLVVEYYAAQLGDINTSSVSLPNGTLAPLIGTNQGITVDLGKGAKLYVVAGSGVYALGVAIPISGLDSVGAALGGINFFPMFSIDKATGAAGIFASLTPGKSGFAFFVDASAYMNGLDWGNIISTSDAVAMSQELMEQEVANDVVLDYKEQVPSAAKEKKLKSILLDMHNRKVRLKR